MERIGSSSGDGSSLSRGIPAAARPPDTDARKPRALSDVGATRWASASRTFCWIFGDTSMSAEKPFLVTWSAVTGDVVVTVAVRDASNRSAISPAKSPARRLRTCRFLVRTSAEPFTRM